jgi:hypothetical protein
MHCVVLIYSTTFISNPTCHSDLMGNTEKIVSYSDIYLVKWRTDVFTCIGKDSS